MLAVFLFAAVLGAGLLLSGLFGSDAEEGMDGGGPPKGDGMAHELVSVRALAYFLAGFGATGSLLVTVAGAEPGSALVWAVATGAIASSSAAVLYRWLKSSESGLVETVPGDLVGLPARVLVPVTAGYGGKVLALHQGRELELLARLYGDSDGDCPRGSTVVIVEMDGETALVTPSSFRPA